MIYQTYGAITTTAVELRLMEPGIINAAGIGSIQCVPMSNLSIWSGAVVLCSWGSELVNSHPSAMYLVDADGNVHQFYGNVDVLMSEGIVFDLTIPYANMICVAEKVLLLASKLNNTIQWWDVYIQNSILMNLQNSSLVKYAVELAKVYDWPVEVINQIKTIKIKSTCSPLHRAKRLHFLAAEREPRIVPRID